MSTRCTSFKAATKTTTATRTTTTLSSLPPLPPPPHQPGFTVKIISEFTVNSWKLKSPHLNVPSIYIHPVVYVGSIESSCDSPLSLVDAHFSHWINNTPSSSSLKPPSKLPLPPPSLPSIDLVLWTGDSVKC